MTGRALAAMVQARLYVSRGFVLYACAAAALAAWLAPAGAAVPLLLCSALGIVAALEQTPGRHPHLDRCEQSAPLFGRELARAKALIPCAAAIAAVAVYAAVQIVRGLPDTGETAWTAGVAVVATTLVALSATLRRGWTRVLYVVSAGAVAGAAYAVAVVAPRSIAAESLFCAVVAFIALRQYGETLARYDPV
jgi:hypothetical protein